MKLKISTLRNTVLYSLIYFKKLFNLKNILLFIIIFLCLLTFRASLIMLLNIGVSNTGNSHLTWLNNKWRVNFMIYNLYFLVVLNYSFIYLEKNKITRSKWPIVLMITFLTIFFYFVLYIIYYFRDIHYHLNHSKALWESNYVTMCESVMFFLFVIISINIINLWIKRYTMKYFLLLFMSVMFIIYFMYFMYWTTIIQPGDRVPYLENIIIIEAVIFVILYLIFSFKYLNEKIKFDNVKKVNT